MQTQEIKMASIKEHTSADVTKLLLVGDSGSGKTAALASLANAGKKSSYT